jgi:hypothetical protein
MKLWRRFVNWLLRRDPEPEPDRLPQVRPMTVTPIDQPRPPMAMRRRAPGLVRPQAIRAFGSRRM